MSMRFCVSFAVGFLLYVPLAQAQSAECLEIEAGCEAECEDAGVSCTVACVEEASPDCATALYAEEGGSDEDDDGGSLSDCGLYASECMDRCDENSPDAEECWISCMNEKAPQCMAEGGEEEEGEEEEEYNCACQVECCLDDGYCTPDDNCDGEPD